MVYGTSDRGGELIKCVIRYPVTNGEGSSALHTLLDCQNDSYETAPAFSTRSIQEARFKALKKYNNTIIHRITLLCQLSTDPNRLCKA